MELIFYLLFQIIFAITENEIKKRIEDNNTLKNMLNKNVSQNMEKANELIQSLERFKREQNESGIKLECVINDKTRYNDDNLINLETTQKDLVCFFDTSSSNMIKEDKENLENYDILGQLVSNTLPIEIDDFYQSVVTLRDETNEQLKESKINYELNCEQLSKMTNDELNLLAETSEQCEREGKLIKEKIQSKSDKFTKIRVNLNEYSNKLTKTETDLDKELDNAFSFNVELRNTYKSELNLKENHLNSLKRDLVNCDPTGILSLLK